MGVAISDEELKSVRSGTALRFTVSVTLDNVAEKKIGQWQKGYMAFRAEDGSLEIKPPVTPLKLYGRDIKYYAAGLTPDAVALITSYIEDNWGHEIKASPDWNSERKGRREKQKEEGWRR